METGEGFAFFRSHALAAKWRIEWTAPGERSYSEERNHGPCGCSRQFLVSDDYHIHFGDVCHNRTQCGPFNG